MFGVYNNYDTVKTKEFYEEIETNLKSVRATRDGSRTAATSKMERFVTIVNGVLNVAAVLAPSRSNSIEADKCRSILVPIVKNKLQEEVYLLLSRKFDSMTGLWEIDEIMRVKH